MLRPTPATSPPYAVDSPDQECIDDEPAGRPAVHDDTADRSDRPADEVSGRGKGPAP
jgi:hypothetical protein